MAGSGEVRGQLVPDKVAAPAGREVPELATSRSRTWAKADGTMVTRVWNRDVNVKSGGKWSAIDNALRSSAAGGFVKGQGGADLRVPSSSAQALRLRDGDRWLDLRLAGSDVAGKVAGPTATYAGAGKGVDLKLTAFNDAVKEDLVLAGADSQSSFTYDVGLSPGLSLELRKDGGADVVDKSGGVAFAIPAPVAQDAKGAVAVGDAATLSYAAGKLTVSLSKDWLSVPERGFPVTLDPSAVIGASGTTDTYADQNTPTTSYASAGDLYVGREAAGHNHTALLRFDLTGQLPASAVVQEAVVEVWPKYQTASTGTKNLETHRVTADWDTAATWNKRTAAANWATAGGDFNPGATSVVAGGVSAWKEFTVTDLATAWLNGSNANQGVAITDGGSTVDRAFAFASSEWVDSAARPYMEIEWYANTGAKSNWTLTSQEISARSSVAVNVAGGNLLLSSSDLQVASTGIPVSVSRSYNSQDSWWGMFGYKGRIGIGNDVALHLCDGVGSRCLVGPGGTRARFPRISGGAYKTPAGVGNVTLRRATPSSGAFTLTENGSGIVYEFPDNDFAYVESMHDRNGNTLTFEHNGTNDALSKITDSRGRAFPVTSNGDGYITSISVPNSVISGGQTWSYGYTGDLLTSVTDPENNTTTYTYVSDLLTKIHDPRGNDTLIEYDAEDRVTKITRKVDGTTTNDVITGYAYTSTLTAPCAGVAKVVGQTTLTDPRGNATIYCWDQSGQVLKAKDAKGNNTATTYNPQGNSTQFDNFYGGTSALGSTTTNYDPNGMNPSQLTDAVGSKTTLGYPTPGATPDPEQAAHPTSVTEDNKNGSPASAGTKNVTNYTYDTKYNVTQVQSNASTLKATLTYNADGQIATAKDGNNNTTTYGYDAVTHELTSVTPQPLTPAGGIGQTKYTYDGVSRVKTVTNGYTGPGTGKTITYGYDKLGQITSIVDSDGQTTTLLFDGNGNVTSRTTGTQVTSYVHDKLGRKTSETLPGPVTNTYTYDKAGNLKTLTDPSGLVTYEYDVLNRTSKVTSPTATTGNDDTTYAYNDPGSAAAGSTHSNVVETLPGAGKVTTTADLAGKTTEVLVNTSSAQTLKRGYVYDTSIAGAATQSEVLIKATDYGSGSSAVTTTLYGYGDNDQVTDIQTVNGTGGSNVRSDSFTYDNAGNRVTKTTALGAAAATTLTSAYNANNQLCWQYSGTTANTCGSAPAGATSYAYDASGNQTTGGSAALTWDARLRLKTAGSSTVTHLSPTNNELTAIGSDSYHNTVLGPTRITTAGNLEKIVREPGSASAVSLIKDGVKRWFVTDQIGSTIALIDSTGTVTRDYAYGPNGNDTTTAYGSGANPQTSIKYAGGHDVGNSLYHFGARYYSGGTGRWTQPDPLDQPGDLGQMNRYIYAGNNPINSTDPSGQFISPKPLLRAGSKVVKAISRHAPGPKWRNQYIIASLSTAGVAAGCAPTPVVVATCTVAGLNGAYQGSKLYTQPYDE